MTNHPNRSKREKWRTHLGVDYVSITDSRDRVVVRFNRTGDDRRDLSHAFLIGAAPELYAALDDLLAAHEGDEPSAIALAKAAARAALAKASHN